MNRCTKNFLLVAGSSLVLLFAGPADAGWFTNETPRVTSSFSTYEKHVAMALNSSNQFVQSTQYYHGELDVPGVGLATKVTAVTGMQLVDSGVNLDGRPILIFKDLGSGTIIVYGHIRFLSPADPDYFKFWIRDTTTGSYPDLSENQPIGVVADKASEHTGFDHVAAYFTNDATSYSKDQAFDPLSSNLVSENDPDHKDPNVGPLFIQTSGGVYLDEGSSPGIVYGKLRVFAELTDDMGDREGTTATFTDDES